MRYATFNAARPGTTDESSRSVSLSCSRPRAEMLGCSIKRTGSPRRWHGTAIPNPSTSKRPTPTSPSSGRATTASRGQHHLRRSEDPSNPNHRGISDAETATRRARRLKFQICLARISAKEILPVPRVQRAGALCRLAGGRRAPTAVHLSTVSSSDHAILSSEAEAAARLIESMPRRTRSQHVNTARRPAAMSDSCNIFIVSPTGWAGSPCAGLPDGRERELGCPFSALMRSPSGRGTSCACRRDQSMPPTSTTSCDAESCCATA
jgi:hypothetical protein